MSEVPITKDQARVSLIRLLEAGAIGGIVLWGSSQVLEEKVADVKDDLKEHRDLGGHLAMERRMAAMETLVAARADQTKVDIREIKESIKNIENEIRRRD